MDEQNFDNQITLTKLFIELTKRSVEVVKNHPRIYENKTPDEIFTFSPPDKPLLKTGKITSVAFDAFSSFQNLCETQDHIDALYDIILSEQLGETVKPNITHRIKALEYAIWDAKYRFEELSIKSIENFHKASIEFAPTFEVDKREIIKAIQQAFSTNKKNRGINTHIQLLHVPAIEGISRVSSYGLAVSLDNPEWGHEFRSFLEQEMQRKTDTFHEQKKREQDNFKSLSNSVVHECGIFAVENCSIEKIVNYALQEPIAPNLW